MRKLALALVAGGSLCLPALAWADDAGAIAERVVTFEAAFNEGDAAGVAAHYTTDAVILPPDMAALNGRDAAEAMWAGFIDAGVTDLKLSTVVLEVAGDTAHELGNFSLSVPDGNGGMVDAGGKYVILWKKDDAGVWHLHWDIWNNDPAG